MTSQNETAPMADVYWAAKAAFDDAYDGTNMETSLRRAIGCATQSLQSLILTNQLRLQGIHNAAYEYGVPDDAPLHSLIHDALSAGTADDGALDNAVKAHIADLNGQVTVLRARVAEAEKVAEELRDIYADAARHAKATANIETDAYRVWANRLSPAPAVKESERAVEPQFTASMYGSAKAASEAGAAAQPECTCTVDDDTICPKCLDKYRAGQAALGPEVVGYLNHHVGGESFSFDASDAIPSNTPLIRKSDYDALGLKLGNALIDRDLAMANTEKARSDLATARRELSLTKAAMIDWTNECQESDAELWITNRVAELMGEGK